MAADEHKKISSIDQRGTRATDFDLSNVSGIDGVAAAMTAARSDPIAKSIRELTETSTQTLKRSMAELDPFGSMGDDALRRSMLGTVSFADKAFAEAVKESLAERALRESLGGSLVSRVEREMIEARVRSDDLIMGRGATGTYRTGLSRAEAEAAGLLSSINGTIGMGSTMRSAIEQAYGSIGSVARDHLLGRIAGVGSLGTIAMGLADPLSDMELRTGRMVADAQRQMEEALGVGAFGRGLRGAHADLFPSLRTAQASELDMLAAAFGRDGRTTSADLFRETRTRLEAASIPWVRVDAPEVSIEALTRFSRLGDLVEHQAPSSELVVGELRTRLGDYREAEQLEPELVSDPIARTGLQLAYGFDPVLSALPMAVVTAMFAPLGLTSDAAEVDPDQLENAVRMFLKRLELALRKFIMSKLQGRHGENWIRQVPGEVRKDWERKQRKETGDGRKPESLIHYADIDHYRRIIERTENWTELFEPVFGDQVAIRETLRRIGVIRNPNSHFRAVTVEDLIILRGEAAHLSRWLGISLVP